MPTVTSPPLQQTFMKGDVWQKWISEVGDSLVGEWFSEDWTNSWTGSNPWPTPSSSRIVCTGGVMHIQATWASVNFDSDMVLTLPYPVKTGVLQIWSGSTLQNEGIVATGTTMTCPDTATISNVVVQGSLVLSR